MKHKQKFIDIKSNLGEKMLNYRVRVILWRKRTVMRNQVETVTRQQVHHRVENSQKSMFW